MRTDRAKTILPTSWIFLILTFLCCHMLSHPEPAPLAQLPQQQAKADISDGFSTAQELPVFLRKQNSSTAILQKLEAPPPQIEAAELTALLHGLLAAPQVQTPGFLSLERSFQHAHTFRGVLPNFSRSPPLA